MSYILCYPFYQNVQNTVHIFIICTPNYLIRMNQVFWLSDKKSVLTGPDEQGSTVYNFFLNQEIIFLETLLISSTNL